MTTALAMLLAALVPAPTPTPVSVASTAPYTTGLPKAETPARVPPPSDYRIGPEDLLEIDVWNKPELSRRGMPVRPDGQISLPLVNDIQAAGLTPMELRGRLLARLAEYMAAPEVSVIVTDVRSFKVSVIGEVSKPGRFELKGRIRLVDALALAGGLTDYASRSNLLVLRSNGKDLATHRFDYDKLRAADARVINFFLEPDDVVLVP
jgi:polysaccharide biosynthesis/export protein